MNRAFPGSGPDVHAAYQRAGHWILAAVYDNEKSRIWCDKQFVPFRKAQSEGIGSAGGFLVPDELATAILDLRDSFGAFRRRARVYPMGSDSTSFDRRTGTAQAFFFGENTGATQTQLGMDQVKLTAKKLGALVLLSNELDEDAIVEMVDYVAYELAWALAAKEDDCAFNGNGASTYGGMRGLGFLANDGNHNAAKVTAAAGHNTYSLLDAVDLSFMVAAVRASAIPRAAWFTSVTGYGQTFTRLSAANGGGNVEMRIEDGIPTPFFNGFPIIMTQKLPLVSTTLTGQAMLAFGDMYGAAVLGQRRGLTIKRSDERYFDTDQIGVLCTERFDAVIHDMGDATNAGSIAVLVAP